MTSPVTWGWEQIFKTDTYADQNLQNRPKEKVRVTSLVVFISLPLSPSPIPISTPVLPGASFLRNYLESHTSKVSLDVKPASCWPCFCLELMLMLGLSGDPARSNFPSQCDLINQWHDFPLYPTSTLVSSATWFQFRKTTPCRPCRAVRSYKRPFVSQLSKWPKSFKALLSHGDGTHWGDRNAGLPSLTCFREWEKESGEHMQGSVVPSQITDDGGADQSTYSGGREGGEIGLIDGSRHIGLIWEPVPKPSGSNSRFIYRLLPHPVSWWRLPITTNLVNYIIHIVITAIS